MTDTTAAGAIGTTMIGAPAPAGGRGGRSGRLGRVRGWTYLLLGLAAFASLFPLY